jgi:XRE family transcriptional regulator, regulator of sulfur utilization
MDNKVQSGFGSRLRAIRESKGLTQEELAYKADLHFTYVGQVERGLRNVTLQSIYKLAKALKIKGGDLLPF